MHHSRWHMTSAKNYGCKEEILNTPAAGKLFSMALIDLSTRDSNQIHSSYCMPEGRAHEEPPSPQLFHTLLFCFWVQRWGHLHCLRFSCGHIPCPATGFLINWMLAKEMFSYWSKKAEKNKSKKMHILLVLLDNSYSATIPWMQAQYFEPPLENKINCKKIKTFRLY